MVAQISRTTIVQSPNSALFGAKKSPPAGELLSIINIDD
ncbi:hypothetical protein M989_02760 [Kluyvera georgiana ATCC 51603]|uniref:Uncharacterized protein n=1 Tax=Kluyvera georgiana ATCC 51603 TaxID=1354264 RepID=A0A1B7JVL8_9ENTR|nr:hypothetical protein M989_02760 [Kluyvera georgiana ATCC 51603]